MPKLSPLFDYVSCSSGLSGFVEREKGQYRRLDRASLLQTPEAAPSFLPIPAAIPSGDTVPKPPAPVVIVVNQVRRRFRTDKGTRRTSSSTDILRLLHAHYPQKLIAGQLGISEGNVSKLRSRLVREGFLNAHGSLTEAGRQLLEG